LLSCISKSPISQTCLVVYVVAHVAQFTERYTALMWANMLGLLSGTTPRSRAVSTVGVAVVTVTTRTMCVETLSSCCFDEDKTKNQSKPSLPQRRTQVNNLITRLTLTHNNSVCCALDLHESREQLLLEKSEVDMSTPIHAVATPLNTCRASRACRDGRASPCCPTSVTRFDTSRQDFSSCQNARARLHACSTRVRTLTRVRTRIQFWRTRTWTFEKPSPLSSPYTQTKFDGNGLFQNEGLTFLLTEYH